VILIVTYDLKQPAATYSGLYEVLKSKRSWWHYMKNTWLIATDDSPQELFDEIDFYIQRETTSLSQHSVARFRECCLRRRGLG